jgi:hypothetical protein
MCADSEAGQMVFDEIIGKALVLMTDVFGNYVIQKASLSLCLSRSV